MFFDKIETVENNLKMKSFIFVIYQNNVQSCKSVLVNFGFFLKNIAAYLTQNPSVCHNPQLDSYFNKVLILWKNLNLKKIERTL